MSKPFDHVQERLDVKSCLEDKYIAFMNDIRRGVSVETAFRKNAMNYADNIIQFIQSELQQEITKNLEENKVPTIADLERRIKDLEMRHKALSDSFIMNNQRPRYW